MTWMGYVLMWHLTDLGNRIGWNDYFENYSNLWGPNENF